MRIIALVTQKGGSGKSTIASSLAVAAAEAGEKVIVVDMDPQASLTRWSRARKDTNIGVTAIAPGKLPNALTAMEKAGITLVVIDTPGTDSIASASAMKVADLCIIPARPNAFDLWASETTRKQLRSLRKEYAFLLNQCPPAQQSARVEQGVEALEAMGGLLNPLIRSRVDYQEATRLGLGVTELHASGEAAEEIRKLWSSLKRRMNKGKAPVRKAA
ncbi:ParA family protein [Roseiarcaceae bacterium H3SJ34-1]|uniref:AAA family ATPase n=1 Tax=Terripilifer ovatus TaxID=3032367 RepID=UPI003AB99B84|nr:ParA family protein [Roseiarcaceae bacterium H3SJ34-1]